MVVPIPNGGTESTKKRPRMNPDPTPTSSAPKPTQYIEEPQIKMVAPTPNGGTETSTNHLSAVKKEIAKTLERFAIFSRSEARFTAQKMEAIPEIDRVDDVLIKAVLQVRSSAKGLKAYLEKKKKDSDVRWSQVESFLTEVDYTVAKETGYVSMIMRDKNVEEELKKKVSETFKEFKRAEATAKTIAGILVRAGIKRGQSEGQEFHGVKRLRTNPSPMPTSSAAITAQNMRTAGDLPKDNSEQQKEEETIAERRRLMDKRKMAKENSKDPNPNELPKATPEVEKHDSTQKAPTKPNASWPEKNNEKETLKDCNNSEKPYPNEPLVGTPKAQNEPEPTRGAFPEPSASQPEKKNEQDTVNGNNGLSTPKQPTCALMLTSDRGTDFFVQCLHASGQFHFKGQFPLMEYDNSDEFLKALHDNKIEDVSLINNPDVTFKKSTDKCSMDQIYKPQSRKVNKFFKNNAGETIEYFVEKFMKGEGKGLNYTIKSVTSRKLPFVTPDFVEKISIHSLEKSKCNKQSDIKCVENFIIFSSKDSFIDVRPDLCASAKYYYVHEGAMVLFVAKPTKTNLALYKEWIKGEHQNEWIVGKLDGAFSRFEIGESKTVVIPPGFLHFIFFPSATTILGGSFLTVSRLEETIQLTELQEQKSEYDTKGIGQYSKDVWMSLYVLAKSLMEKVDSVTGKELIRVLNNPARLNKNDLVGLTVTQKNELMNMLRAQYFPDELQNGNDSDVSMEIE